jgi:mono/diheme cytochrome c family protein
MGDFPAGIAGVRIGLHHSRMPTARISAARIPSALPPQIVNWFGGRGGHVGFSPVMPPDGALALERFHGMRARFEQFGLDYYTSFTMGQRHINNVDLILYNCDDAAMLGNARAVPQADRRRARPPERRPQGPARPQRNPRARQEWHLAARLPQGALMQSLASLALAALLLAPALAAADGATGVATGEQLFHARCALCHVGFAPGTIMLGKRLGKERALLAERTDLNADYIRQIVRHGLLGMPPLTRVDLSEPELVNVVAYLTRSRTPAAATGTP